MTAYIREDLDNEVRRTNFVAILEWMRNLSEKHEAPLDETCILTLCRLAKYVFLFIFYSEGALADPIRFAGFQMMKK